MAGAKESICSRSVSLKVVSVLCDFSYVADTKSMHIILKRTQWSLAKAVRSKLIIVVSHRDHPPAGRA